MNYSIFNVIKNDYCIGCGACVFADKDFSVQLDEYGMYKAEYDHSKINDNNIELAEKYCPFSDNSLDEDKIAEIFFEKEKGLCKKPYAKLLNSISFFQKDEE